MTPGLRVMNDQNVSLIRRHRLRIHESYKLAEAEPHWENRIYTMLNHILFATTDLADTNDDAGVLLVQTQHTLIPHNLPPKATAKQFLNTTPDESLLFSGADKGLKKPGPFFEAKRAFHDDHNAKPFPFLSDAAAACHDIKFEANKSQILWQAFCALNAFPEKDAPRVFLFLVVGARFSLFKVNRPANLKHVPLDLEKGFTITAGDFDVTKLLPKGCLPEILFANESIFATNENARVLTEPLCFSQEFTEAMRLALPEGIDLPANPLFPYKPGSFVRDIKKAPIPAFREAFEEMYTVSEATENALKRDPRPVDAGPLYESPIKHQDPNKTLPKSAPPSPEYTPGTSRQVKKKAGRKARTLAQKTESIFREEESSSEQLKRQSNKGN
ncbi:hypothetical protein D9758_015455 [Tetrapyrgos nigripes]|uniref:Uncharacterized protein n=1 Tax=Tetrapyrgos nigripes TaxID=182062 RepID=A0A8H5FP53_9AGAR|nr:hypothetical protein D9758_015455 [Tetrapyrgos nigripes]